MARKIQKDGNFEESLAALEKLVSEMENDQLPLDKLLLHYEEGNQLLDRCQILLDAARERIEVIRVDGKNDKKPLANDKNDNDTLISDDEPADDIKLF